MIDRHYLEQEIQKAYEEVVTAKGDYEYWCGYRDAMSIVMQLEGLIKEEEKDDE